MKRKFFVILVFLNLIYINANAFSLDMFHSPKKEASAVTDKKTIYCDINNHWCKTSAQRLFEQDIFKGIKIGSEYYFMPDEAITRGEFLLYLNAILNIPCENKNNIPLPFKDASLIPLWQYPTVGIMYEKGYIKGNLEKTGLFFNGDEKISRLECALILSNILTPSTKNKTFVYCDEYLIPSYALNAVKTVTECEILKGYTDNSFRPYIKITRGMLADILWRTKEFLNI